MEMHSVNNKKKGIFLSKKMWLITFSEFGHLQITYLYFNIFLMTGRIFERNF